MKNSIDSKKNHELAIFTSEEDRTGTNIAAMSNFFDVYVDQLTHELNESTAGDVVNSIPVADISIATDLLNHMRMVSRAGSDFILDFDSLPTDVKDKLADGTYHIGESRQVEGNARAVILDQHEVRVKDVTAKEVVRDPGTLNTARSIANQIQLRQIYMKLQDIQELQEYQIDRDRDRDIITPFLDARDYTVQAQQTSDEDERLKYLDKALDRLTTATHSLYTDLKTTSQHLAKCTRLPIFQPIFRRRKYIQFLTSDLQLATKFVGVQMHIKDYLGDTKGAQYVLQEYQATLRRFFTLPINSANQTAADLVHLYFPYDNSNRNYWLDLSREMKPVIEANYDEIEQNKVFVVSLEDPKDNE